ncbi:MAG TPA: DUF2203 domain-containing protein [Candidatus Limnocylindrales bacterium]|jgi:hypothetical protein
MSRFYSIDDANALVPDLVVVIGRLQAQRDELIEIRDAYRRHEGAVMESVGGSSAGGPSVHRVDDDPDDGDADDPELRRLRLRMRGIVDQMQADVAWLDGRSITLRDIPTGLLDFPALVSGRQVWLCWRMGEDDVAFWHGQDEGFAGRRPLADLPGTTAQA